MQYMTEHQNCFNYENGEQPIIELKRVEKNAILKLHTERYKLFFLIEGNVQIEVGLKDVTEADRGFFWFVPSGQIIKVKALNNALFLVVRMGRITLCDYYNLEMLYSNFKENCEESPDEKTLYKGIIYPPLWHCLVGLHNVVSDGLQCRAYFAFKVKEIFLLLRAYYTKQELYCIFYNALTGDLAFSEHVKESWSRYKTVDELAHAMHYTTSGFYKRFVSVFDTSPREWVQKQKELAVYSDLISGDLTLKSIAKKWGFSSMQSLSNYCSKLYNDSPGRIYKNRLQSGNDEING
ncbi:MAG: helix-turn-helix domain-containing protein [Tannerellaceae bacterium]|jgi:AraC-like DNA-binding protein|nr:helix-turn-helix domain-containing protein [Tannerellaceae bacterium]